jgi:hypothetical protein
MNVVDARSVVAATIVGLRVSASHHLIPFLIFRTVPGSDRIVEGLFLSQHLLDPF